MLKVEYCTSGYKQAPQHTYLTGNLVVYVYWVVLLIATCTSVYKQAPKNKPSFSCLCLLSGALSLILYFRVQTGTETNLILSVYVYGVVLLVATCTSVYKPAPKQTYF